MSTNITQDANLSGGFSNPLADHMKAKWGNPEELPDDQPAQAAAAKPEQTTAPAQPAEPVKTAEPDDDGEKWPRKAEDWKAHKKASKERETKLRGEADTYKTELETLRKDIETLRKSGPSPELDTLRKERDDLQERIRMIDVEKDPRFQRYFNSKTETQIKLAEAIVGPTHSDALKKALQLPDGEFRDTQIQNIMDNLTPYQQSRLGGVVNEIALVRQEKESALSEATQNYESLQAQTKAQQERSTSERKAASENAFAAKLKIATEQSSLYQKRENDAEWNATVDRRIATARELMFGNNDVGRVADAVLRAAGFSEATRRADALEADNAKLQEQIKSLTAASPRVVATKSADDQGQSRTGPAIKSGMNVTQINDAWNEWTRNLASQ